MSEPDTASTPAPPRPPHAGSPDGPVRPTLDALDARLGAWRAYLLSHSLVTRRLDEELRAERGISLAEYDALLQLALAPGRTLRMNQLAERVVLSRSGVTRLVDRLVADGLVARASCPSDARGAMAVLTEVGSEALRTASRTHLRGVDGYFLAALTEDDLVALERALEAVIDRASRGTPFEGCRSNALAGAGPADRREPPPAT